MKNLFVSYFYKTNPKDKWRPDNVVLENFPPVIGNMDIAEIEKVISTRYKYVSVTIQNWRRMEEAE